MYAGKKIKLYAPIAAMTFCYAIVPYCSVYAEEIKPFQLTDVNGFVGLRYREDGELTKQAISPQVEELRTNLEEEVHVQTQGYIYHPNFLKFDLGGGVVFSQEELETVTGNTEHDDTLYDLNARLLFLDKKPYPLTLYYEKSHPIAALSTTDVFVHENKKYGMHFSVREPVSPVLVNFESYKLSNKGDSFTQRTDEEVTYNSINTRMNLDDGGFVELSHSQNDQESMSGLKSLPITPFNVDTSTTDFYSRLIFGNQKNIRLDLTSTRIKMEKDRELKETRFSPRLTWQHNKQLSSYYQYRKQERNQTDVDSLNKSGAAGIRYQHDKNLYTSTEVHTEKNDTTGLQQDSYGISGTLVSKHPLSFGELQVSVGLNYDEYDRNSDSNVQVSDVAYVLVGSTAVTLAHRNINLATIEVRREDNGTLLIEGIHYIVTQIGDQTQIEKIIGAGLPDPLNVLVSYTYDPGGSAEYSLLGQRYDFSLDFAQYFTTYFNYREREPDLKSGSPTIPIDSSDTTSYGLRMEYQIPTDIEMTVGGELSKEKHNENISSYKKNRMDIFMQVALPYASSLHVSLRKLEIDHLFSDEDVDLSRYALRLRSRPANRLGLLFQLSDEKDTGGSLLRHTRELTFSGQWRIRRLLAEFGARRVRETQGSAEHERTVYSATLRREF